MRSLLLLCCLCATLPVLRAQSPFHRDIWINEQEAPVQVNAVQADSSGLLWLGTNTGLYTFNGRDVVRAADSNFSVTALAATSKGMFFACKDGRVFRHRQPGPQLLFRSNAPVSGLTATPYGLFAGTLGDGIYHWSGARLHHLTAASGLPDDYVYHIVFTGKGIVFGTDVGFFHGHFNAAYKIAFERAHPAEDIGNVVRGSTKQAGYLWFAFAEKGLFLARPDKIPQAIAIADTLGMVRDVLPVPGGAWICTDGGWLIKVDISGAVQPLLQLPGRINALAAGAGGNLWLATSRGLTMATTGYARQIAVPALSLTHLTAMSGDGKEGIIYAQDNTIFTLHPQTGITRLIGHTPSPVNCLFADTSGTLWIGTSGSGLLRMLPGKEPQPVQGVADLRDAHVLSIAGTPGRLWVSSLNGVDEVLLDEDGQPMQSWHHGKHNGLGSDYVYRIFIDRRQQVWFATDGAGITMFDGSTYHHWDRDQGFYSKVVYGICEDAHGAIWAATLDGGLFQYNGKQWRQWSIKDGLQDATVFSVAALRSGQIVAVTGKGVDIWYPQNSVFRHLNRRSGLGIDSLSGALNATANDTGGNVFIPYQSGFMVCTVQPDGTLVAPAVHLRSVSLFFRSLSPPVRVFDYDQNTLSFGFDGRYYAPSELLHYRYRLEGYNSDFIETSDNEVTFAQLPPGSYRFVVQASFNSSFRAPASAVYSFRIKPPFWRRWWFWLAGVALAAIAVYWLLRWRLRSQQRVDQLRHERMLFEYEHLKSQVNPHFLFNSLNTLASLIEEDTSQAVNYTVQLSDLYRETLTFHESDLVPLAEEWKVLERYLYIQKSRFGNALQLVADVSPGVMAAARIVPLSLQLLVENAIKHNVVSRSKPLVIFIAANETEIKVQNEIARKASPEKGTGLGLGNIRQRYARLTRRAVRWEISGNIFIVILPLI